MSEAAAPPRRPWVAFVLSLAVPGLGQFYSGRWIPAALFYAPLLLLSFALRLLGLFSFLAPTLRQYDMAIIAVAAALALASAVEAAASARRQRHYEPTLFNRWYFYLIGALWTGVVLVCLAGMVTYTIPSSGQSPTVKLGDVIVTWSYNMPFTAPSRGDVAVFTQVRGGNKISFVKRIVALGGDTVAYKNGRLVINGTETAREEIGEEAGATIYRETLPNGNSYRIQEQSDTGPLDNTDVFQVPPGTAFTLGDNRDESADSRTGAMGPVPLEQFHGRVFLVLLAKDSSRIGPLAK